jgi:hypothetical protein
VAKTQVQVDIKSQISIIAALQEAESRVIEGRVLSDAGAALTDSSRDNAIALTHSLPNSKLERHSEYADADL